MKYLSTFDETSAFLANGRVVSKKNVATNSPWIDNMVSECDGPELTLTSDSRTLSLCVLDGQSTIYG